MTQRADNMSEILAVLKEGEKFYRDAAGKVGDASLKSMFTNIADERRTAVADLEPRVKQSGGEATGGSFLEAARAAYAKAAASVGMEGQLVSQLEEHEDRTLEVLRHAIDDPANKADQEILQKYLAIFKVTHDRMRKLKQAA